MRRATTGVTGLIACVAAFALGCGDDPKKNVATSSSTRQEKCAELERKVVEELESGGGVDESSTFGLGECGGSTELVAASSVEDLISEVKGCLDDAGVEARGGAAQRSSEDDDAPDGELLTPGPTFIAFYSTVERADGLAKRLQTRATELGGMTTRHGRVTVLYVKVPETGARGEPDDRIESCVEGADAPGYTFDPADNVKGSSEVRDAIRADDPSATGRALRELGYKVTWLHVRDNPNASAEVPQEGDPLPGASEGATLVTEVESPPAGTIVLTVMNNNGFGRIPPPPAMLMVEVAKPGTAGH